MDNMFTVLPMSQSLELKPGEVYEGVLTVANPAESTTDFNYVVSVAPYGVSGDDYVANLATMTDRTKMVDWISIDEPKGTIAPNGVKQVRYKITVPEGAPGGGQYAAITVTSDSETAKEDGVAVQSVFELASLIYAEVDGEIVHDGEILENNVPGFVTNTPVSVTARFSNNGNVHETAIVKLEVTDAIFGSQILPNDDNDGVYSEFVMPETERLLARDIGNLPMVGVVKVVQSVYYNGETSVVEQNVVICPVWFMVVVAVVIGGVIGLIIRAIMGRRKKRMSEA